MWVTRADLARATGLSASRIQQLRTEFGNQWEHGKGPGLRIYLPAWLQQWLAHREKPQGDRGVADYAERLGKAKAEKAELDLAAARGELVAVSEVQHDVQSLCSSVRDGIEQCCRSCQDVMRSKVLEAAQDFGIEMLNGHSDKKTAKRQAPTKGKGASHRRKPAG